MGRSPWQQWWKQPNLRIVYEVTGQPLQGCKATNFVECLLSIVHKALYDHSFVLVWQLFLLELATRVPRMDGGFSSARPPNRKAESSVTNNY